MMKHIENKQDKQQVVKDREKQGQSKSIKKLKNKKKVLRYCDPDEKILTIEQNVQ